MEIFKSTIGTLGALFIAIAFLPQTIKTIKNRQTKGISLTCYLIYHIGLTFFIIYSSYTKNWKLFAANLTGWIVNSALLSVIFYNLWTVKNTKFVGLSIKK